MEWSAGRDPMVRRKRHVWYLVSLEDAWRLLGKYLLPPDLERFADAVLAVLGSVDPAFDLRSDQRWMAAALDRVPAHSGLLRDGLATTLVIMAVHGAEGPSLALARETPERIVRKLLEAANADWRLARYAPHSTLGYGRADPSRIPLRVVSLGHCCCSDTAGQSAGKPSPPGDQSSTLSVPLEVVSIGGDTNRRFAPLCSQRILTRPEWLHGEGIG